MQAESGGIRPGRGMRGQSHSSAVFNPNFVSAAARTSAIAIPPIHSGIDESSLPSNAVYSKIPCANTARAQSAQNTLMATKAVRMGTLARRFSPSRRRARQRSVLRRETNRTAAANMPEKMRIVQSGRGSSYLNPAPPAATRAKAAHSQSAYRIAKPARDRRGDGNARHSKNEPCPRQKEQQGIQGAGFAVSPAFKPLGAGDGEACQGGERRPRQSGEHWRGKRKYEPAKRDFRHVRRRFHVRFSRRAAFSRRRLGRCPRLWLSCGTRPERRSCSARPVGTCRGSPRASPRSPGMGRSDAPRAPRRRPSRICRR